MDKNFSQNLKTEKGNPDNLGSTLDKNGCNFAIYSKNAEIISLLLFNKNDLSIPTYIVPLNKKFNKTEDVWHIYVYGVKKGQHYGYSIDGPYCPKKKGHRFNPNKLLLDPYAKTVSGGCHWNYFNSYGYDINSGEGHVSFSKEKNYDSIVKSIVIDENDFNWGNDIPLNTPWEDTIIYEMHVRGFTFDRSSKIKYPGTYLGVIEKIPYLKELGITSIELLPIYEFNELENNKFNPVTKERLKNFWGYSPLLFFAPEAWYSTNFEGLSAIKEFKTMVKALHKAGIEVIIDVVYNHTGEGNEFGPTINYKGIDNSIYYILDKHKKYKNYSGCGNTFNCNNPIVKRLILDSLKYWVINMHVDGFRFDLATVLGRDEQGNWIDGKSLLSDINDDPVLSKTKIISESWDAGGLFKLGKFPPRWAEWNGKFKEDVRSFIKADNHKIIDFANRVFGSPDLFSKNKKNSYFSVNYISCHDGFTLNDVVSYNDKHNKNNGENNKDGENNNFSSNYGVEGITYKREIIDLRERQIKNLFLILMISQGTPMVLSGDEVKFSKNGNNNTYAHDNELNWFNWDLLKKDKNFFEFCKFMIRFRKIHPVLRMTKFITNKEIVKNSDFITWHGVAVGEPDFSFESHAIAFILHGSKCEYKKGHKDQNIYVAINSFWEDLIFNIPAPEKKEWYLSINTDLNPSFYKQGKEHKIKESTVLVKQRSIVVLIEK